MSDYNRTDILGSMKAHMEKTATEKSEPTKDDSADTATTAEAQAEEETAESATADEAQGDGEGEGAAGEAEDGGEPTPAEPNGTTGEGEEGETPEQEAPAEGEEPAAKKWEEEDQKQLKEWGLEGMPANEHTRKLAKIARDNQKAFTEERTKVTALSSQFQFLGQALSDGDLNAVDEICDVLGADRLPFDRRTIDDQIKEVADGYNEIYDTFKAAFTPEDFAVIEKVLGKLEQKAKARLSDLKDKKKASEIEANVAKRFGAPVKGGAKAALEKAAHTAFVNLKAKDPQAERHMNALKPYFESTLLNFNGGYARQPEKVDELGKKVAFYDDFKTVHLPKLRKQIEDELKLRRSVKAPPPSRGSTTAQPSGKPATRNANQNHFVAQKLAARFQR